MSFKALAWAFRQQLDTHPKMVLLVLADHHNAETGQCNPAVKRLADNAGCTERTVERSTQNLETLGLLVIEKRKREDGSYTSNWYHLNVDHDISLPGDSVSLGSVTVAPGSVTVSPHEPVIEPKGEISSETNVSSSAKKKENEIDNEWREQMHIRFGSVLGGKASVDERIDEALNHKASNKWKNEKLGVLGWLRRDAERVKTGRSQPGRHNPSTNPKDFERF
jgi:hypothetical protein